MNLMIASAIVYILIYPLLFRLTAYMQRRLVVDRQKTKDAKKKIKRDIEDQAKPIWPTWRKRIRFALSDKRGFQLRKKKNQPSTSGFQNRFMLAILYITGLVLTIVSTLGDFQIILAGLGALFFLFTVAFALTSPRDVLKERQRIMDRLFEIAESALQQSVKNKANPEAVITVKEWREFVKLQKIEFKVPTKFKQESEQNFMNQLNQVFGRETSWVPSHDSDKGEEGWDYEKGLLTVRAVPPLPQKAPWDEHYVLSEAIAWSFFPIALGVENGVELPNPKTGEVENVLGFDVSGMQAKVGKEAGVKVSPTITTSPMTFVGGGTGGGKSLSVDTRVLVLSADSDDSE